MKILKQVEGSKIALYSFETANEMTHYYINLPYSKKVIFRGGKWALEIKKDEFWRPLVESDKEGELYRCYINGGWYFTPSESGRSALQTENEFILITQETV